MKNKRTLTITIIAMIITLAATGAFFGVRDAQSVHAQDPPPAPGPSRSSFGMIGITSGQTMRLGVTNIIVPGDYEVPPDPCRVTMNFRGMNGQPIRDGRGEVIHRTVMLENGDSTFLDVNYDELPPGPTRLQLRAVVNVQPPSDPDLPPDPCIPTVEVITNSNGRTSLVVQRAGWPEGHNHNETLVRDVR